MNNKQPKLEKKLDKLIKQIDSLSKSQKQSSESPQARRNRIEEEEYAMDYHWWNQ